MAGNSRVTKKDLMDEIERVNGILRSAGVDEKNTFVFFGAYGYFGVNYADGSSRGCPRGTKREIVEWLRAFRTGAWAVYH